MRQKPELCVFTFLFFAYVFFLLNEFLLLLEKVNFHHYRKRKTMFLMKEEREKERGTRDKCFPFSFPSFLNCQWRKSGERVFRKESGRERKALLYQEKKKKSKSGAGFATWVVQWLFLGNILCISAKRLKIKRNVVANVILSPMFSLFPVSFSWSFWAICWFRRNTSSTAEEEKIENGLPPTPAAKNYTCSRRNMKVGWERHKSALFISFSLFRRSICRDNSFVKTRPVKAPIKRMLNCISFRGRKWGFVARCRSRKIEVTTASCFYVRAVLFSSFFSDEKKSLREKTLAVCKPPPWITAAKKGEKSVSHLVSVVGSRRRTPVKSYSPLHCTRDSDFLLCRLPSVELLRGFVNTPVSNWQK